MRWKQTKKKGILATALAMAMVLAFTGCGASSDSPAVMTMQNGMADSYKSESASAGAMMDADYSMNMAEAEMEPMESAMDTGNGENGSTSALVNTDRKLIRTVNMDLETQEFDVLMSALSDQIADMGGYVESMETYNGSRYSGRVNVRNAYMTVRIPKNKLDGFLDTVSGAANVIRRSENVQDVTLNYVDLESHKKVLEAEQERLLAFLEQATTVEEMITLEERLSNVRYQLERMEAQLRTFDNQVDYSTVHIDIQEVKELTEVPEEEPTRLERLKDGFVENLESVGEGFLDFGIWLVVNIPYFVVWALIIGGIVWFIKFLIRRSKKKKAKKLAKLQEQQAK